MALMPPSLRPWVGVPVLDRETLKELRAEVVAALGEQVGQPGGTAEPYPQ